jgi:1-acyl-sn-glycerol-3-phosphate acyltransferase
MENTEPVPFGLASTLLRIALAWVIFIPVAVVVLLLTIPLMPWRGARVRLSFWAMNRISPPILRCLGTPIEAPPASAFTAHGPVIYVINHTSTLDTALVGALMPPGTCGLSKKETLFYPFFGQAFWLSGHLLVDRGNRERAIASVARLVTVMRKHRLSLIIGPEGTRSRDGRLAAFKKGFVHVAIATRLPVVPVLFVGAQKAWPVDTLRLAPHPVTVQVLDPVPTDDWSVERLEEHLAHVHSLMADALPPEQKPL